METRQGDGTEALSQETESNGSATPKSRRHPLTLPEHQQQGVSESSRRIPRDNRRKYFKLLRNIIENGERNEIDGDNQREAQ